MKKIYLLLIVFIGAFAYSVTAQDDVMLVIPKNGAATVDGYVDPDDDPWQDDAWVEYGATLGTTTDASAKFQMSWSDDVLSVVIEVQDATEAIDPDAIANSYERDCAEIFLHMSAEKPETAAYESNTWQIRFQRDNHLVDGSGGVAGMLEADGFEVESFSESTMYTIEVNLPFATLADESGWTPADQFFYMHLSVGDNTTGEGSNRTQQLFWLEDNGDLMWSDKTLFKRVELGEATLGINSKAANVQASAFVHNNTLKLKNVQGEIAIYNINGAMVKKAMVNPGQSSMDISDLKTGVYVVRGKNLAAKIVK